VLSTQFLLIRLTNPEAYLNKANLLQKRMMKANNRMYGTPISISSNTLKCSFFELEQMVSQAIAERQQGNNSTDDDNA